jgi:diguanylate cyclase (GGDEF)-like protein
MDVIESLKGVPLLNGLAHEALVGLSAYANTVSFSADETVVEMDASTPLFVQRALLSGEPVSANIEASEEARLLMLEQKAFQELVARIPEVAIQILENLSNQMARTDELIRDLSDSAMRDALTGILNRRAYDERLAEEVDRSLRYSEHFSLILTDLDRFKSINDTYGHDTGDVVLQWIGRLLTEHTRSPDTPFRIGGEEFAILAPATNAEVAHHVARRLVDIVSEARPPLDFELKVTMSAGFACCPDHGESVSSLFGVADRALLRAKAEGRNRVCGPPDKATTPIK